MFKWLRRNKQTTTPEIKASLAYGILSGESHRPEQQREMMDDLQINFHLIRSHRLESVLEQLYKMALEQDNGNPDLDLIALGALVDGLIRVSHLEPIDAQIGYLKTRRILRRIEMNSPQREGIINLIEAIELERMTAWNDAIGGWKAKLTKVTPKTFEVTMRETKSKEPML